MKKTNKKQARKERIAAILLSLLFLVVAVAAAMKLFVRAPEPVDAAPEPVDAALTSVEDTDKQSSTVSPANAR